MSVSVGPVFCFPALLEECVKIRGMNTGEEGMKKKTKRSRWNLGRHLETSLTPGVKVPDPAVEEI